MPNDFIWWRIDDLFFVVEFEFVRGRHHIPVPVFPELGVVLGGFGPFIEFWNPFPHDFAGRQKISADFNHFWIEWRRQDELACGFNPLSRKVHQRRLDEAAPDMVNLFSLEELQTGLDAQIRMDALEDAGCR